MPVIPALGVTRTERISDESIPHNHHHVDCVVELSDENYQKYLRATDALVAFRSDAQLFTLTIWNYQEYYDILNAYLDAYIDKNEIFLSRRPAYLDINRCMLNFLSSVRTYLDHIEFSTKRRYGKDSDVFKQFHQNCANAYDNNFSYRFLYKLRNYSQHCGLPINNLSFNTGPSDENPSKPYFSLHVAIDRDSLLKDFDWSKIGNEVKAQPSSIDINQHIDVFMKCIESINSDFIRDEFSKLLDSAKYVKQLMQGFEYTEGEPCAILLEVEQDDNGRVTSITNMDISPVPIEIVDAVISGHIENIIQSVEVYTL